MPHASGLSFMVLLFVYGSLKRGQANHEQLRGARFVGNAQTAPRYALRVVDGYPGLAPGARAIAGELFEFASRESDAGRAPALAALDAFEGSAYRRGAISLADGTRVTTYLLREPEAGEDFAADEWPREAGSP